MGQRDNRIEKLFPALTAQERAILVLRAAKAKREEDYKVRLTTPPDRCASSTATSP